MNASFEDGLKWYLVFLLSTTVHEAAHAWSSLRLGDDTAARGGQVSLNPWPHLRREPLGMVLVPLVSYFMGGWMIGWASAPYNLEWARRFPRRSALMALAGPLSNLFLVLLAFVLMRLGWEWGFFQLSTTPGFLHVITSTSGELGEFCAKMLSLFFSLNLLLACFNLLPLPPLDGSALPLLILPKSLADAYATFIRNPRLSWVGLYIGWKCFGFLFSPVQNMAYHMLSSGLR